MLFFESTTWSSGITYEPSVLYDCEDTEFDVTYETYELVTTEKFRLLCGKRAFLVTMDSGTMGRAGYLVDDIDLACDCAEEMWEVSNSEKQKLFYFLELYRSTN